MQVVFLRTASIFFIVGFFITPNLPLQWRPAPVVPAKVVLIAYPSPLRWYF